MPADRGPVFPFTAIVGQERMKLALVLNAIEPSIGGVLIRGERGTAKSTTVRALADVLPPIEVIEGCPYSCEPRSPQGLCHVCTEPRGLLPRGFRPVRMVDLPIGATEDRVVGTLDIEAALKLGEKRFQPGLLAEAHRGIIYIDEVNLLSDHLVDILLDSAAMGQNYVEREGVSFSHAARFVLIGTMNPEEGEVRPQLLDRFGLAVEVETLSDPEQRAEVVRRRLQFDADPEAFRARWRPQEEALRRRIQEAQAILPSVQADEGLLAYIAQVCLEHHVEGLRADIVTYRAARVHAAFQGRDRALREDVDAVAELALLHRRRPPRQPQPLARPPSPDRGPGPAEGRPAPETSSPPAARPGERTFAPGPAAEPPTLLLREEKAPPLVRAGRRATVRRARGRGRYVTFRFPRGRPVDLALGPTLRAAAVRTGRLWQPRLPLRVLPEDLREKVREEKVGALLLFLVDASASMAARRRMATVKGAIQHLLADAYRQRDRVALVCARGQRATVVLPPTGSGERARRALEELPTGGATPLAAGLALAHHLLERHRLANPRAPALLLLASDGRANVAQHGGDPLEEAIEEAERLRRRGFRSVILDAEAGPGFRLGMLERLAYALGARRLPVAPEDGESLARSIRLVLR